MENINYVTQPNGWITRKLWTLGSFGKGKNIKKEDLVDTGRPVILYSHIYTTYDRKTESTNYFVSEDLFLESTKIDSGTFLFTSSGESREEIGKTLLYSGDQTVCVGGDQVLFHTNGKYEIDNNYLSFFLNSHEVQYQKTSNSKGEIVVHIYERQLRELDILLPPLNEQQLISRYLDKKTEQIDSLIEKIQKKIELLREQRTSLINQCVTKGLDPNVEMKDSGIDWIGEIPSHWDVKKFSYVSKLETGNTPSKTLEELYFTEEDDGFPWVKPSDLDVGLHGVSKTESRLTEEGRLESRVVPKDSILVCCIGNTSGKYSIANVDLSTNQQINSITFDGTVLPRYGLFYMDVFGRDLLKWMNFVTLPIISKGDLSEQPVLVPPLEEQISISEFLDRHLEVHMEVMNKESQRIVLLTEYRQSLISSIVTGKFRVTEDMI